MVFLSLPMGNRHHIVRARFLLFFYLALLSLMPKWKLQIEAAVVLVWWYVVIMWKKTPNVNLLKLQSWTNDFDKKNLGLSWSLIQNIDTFVYYCILHFRHSFWPCPWEKTTIENNSIFSNQDWTLFQEFFWAKNFNRDRGIVHFLLQLTYQMGTVAYYVESDDLTHFQQPFLKTWPLFRMLLLHYAPETFKMWS